MKQFIERASYGSIGVLVAFADYPVVVLIPAFYASELGISLTAIGIIMFTSRLFDILSDPLVGVVSDKFRNVISYKFWVVVGIPLFVAALAALFHPPLGAGEIYLFVTLLVLYVFRTAVDVPHNALASSASKSEAMRLQFFGYKSVFLVLGILVTGIAIATTNGQIGPALSLISKIGAVASIPCLIFFLLFAPDSLKINRVLEIGVKSLKFGPNTKALFAAFFCNQVGNAFAATLVIIYIRDVLLLEQSTGIFLGLLFLASALSVPIWIYCSTKYSTVSSWFVSVSISIPVFLAVCLLSQGAFLPYLAVCAIAGCLFGADAIYPPALLAQFANSSDKVDQSSHGALFASKSALSKLSLVIPTVIAFPVVDYFQTQSPDKYGFMVIFFYSVFPIFFKILALYFISKLKVIDHFPTSKL